MYRILSIPKLVNKFLLDILIIMIALCGVSLFIYYSFKSQSIFAVDSPKMFLPTSTPTIITQSGWKWYENRSAGFRVSYPKEWGKPDFTSYGGDSGVSYRINFLPGPQYRLSHGTTTKSRSSIMIGFDSIDFSKDDSMPGVVNRKIGPYTTKKSIERMIKSIKSEGTIQWGTPGESTTTIVDYNSKSYSILLDNIHKGATNELSVFQFVNLPKLKVDSAFVIYEILDRPSSCEESKLSKNDKEGCLTFEINDTLIKVLSSLQEI